MKKRMVAVALSTVMALGLAACSSETASTEAETTAAATEAAKAEETEAATEAAAEASGDAEYAIILKTQATDFWVKMWIGIEAEAV